LHCYTKPKNSSSSSAASASAALDPLKLLREDLEDNDFECTIRSLERLPLIGTSRLVSVSSSSLASSSSSSSRPVQFIV
jgi:hypothetical protein